jgi:hypothetical protein
MTISGAYAEFVCLPERELIPVPSGVDAAEGVSLILNFITAYQMLHRSAKVRSGQRVLIHGASGGVGTAIPPNSETAAAPRDEHVPYISSPTSLPSCKSANTAQTGKSRKTSFGGTKAVQNFGIQRKRLENRGKRMAPQVGFEPTTLRLTAGCSTIELLRSVVDRAWATIFSLTS